MADVVDQIKARLDIVDVISEKVLLKKAGKTLKGLCPFHVEKTPSFIVFPETGTWHCFGCGAGGDLFNFVMQSENLTFPEVLALLAVRAGVELQRGTKESHGSNEHATLFEVNEAAADYFRSMLEGPVGSHARSYLQDREISGESVERFQIGFAPDMGAGLAHHLLQQGFGRSDVLTAGLAGENESGGLYDRFRGRLIFPIRDTMSKLVGFGGRALAKEQQPKYLNTPQTPIFDKGGSLYGIDRAKQEIRHTGQAVIVEGYVDALMAHQYGYANVVAALGTAVTDRQLSLLKRWASELCFALDPDEAGQEATARGLSVAMGALERDVTPVPTWKGLVDYVYKLKGAIKIISLPGGKDPDEVIREDPSRWQQLVQSAVPVQEFFLERVRRKHDLSSASGKAAAVEEAMAVIGEIPEPVQQAHYVQRLAAMVGVEEAILLQQVRRGSVRRPFSTVRPVAEQRDDRPEVDLEAYCLAIILKSPSVLEGEPQLRAEHFGNPAFREIFRRAKEVVGSGKGDVEGTELLGVLRSESEGPLRDSLEELVSMEDRYPLRLQDQLGQAYRAAAIGLVLSDLQLRRQQIEAAWSSRELQGDPEETIALERAEYEIAVESHRLKLLGDTIPLRAIHKEVRHGG